MHHNIWVFLCIFYYPVTTSLVRYAYFKVDCICSDAHRQQYNASKISCNFALQPTIKSEP